MIPAYRKVTGVLCGCLLALSAQAVNDVQVLALFGDQAVIKLDGVQRRLKTGEVSPEGVRLIGVTTEAATLEIDGRRQVYPLGGHVTTGFSAPVQPEVQIWRDPKGMFTTVGSINGYPVNFLVDTGATMVVMNAGHARRFGIDYRLNGEQGAVMTASGVERAYNIKLNSVKVGGIELHNVDASVLEGSLPAEVLLGMSFLQRLEIRNTGQALLLKKKY